jgi:hypothetical protein
MKKLNFVLNGVEELTKEQMKKVIGGETTPVTVQCLCNGVPAGYCICSSTPECIECCEVACSA